MAKSKETYSKKEKEKLKAKKKKEKMLRSEERKANSGGGGLDSMMAYVDEFGRIVDAPIDPSTRVEIDAESIEIGIPRREDNDDDGFLWDVTRKASGDRWTGSSGQFFDRIDNLHALYNPTESRVAVAAHGFGLKIQKAVLRHVDIKLRRG